MNRGPSSPEGNPITAHEYRRRCLAVRIALAAVLAGAALGVLGAGMDVVAGAARAGGGPVGAGVGDELAIAIGVGGALAAGGMLVPRVWVHLVGILGATVVSFGAAGAVVRARSSERLVADVAPGIETGGVLLITAFALGTLGLLVALFALRQIAQNPEDDPGATRPAAGVAGKANIALALGMLSLIIPPLAGLAVAMGTLAHGDIRRSQNQLEGLARASAGSVLGTFVLALVIVAGIIGVIVVRPAG